MAGTAHTSAVVAKARELLKFASHHGYRRDELITLIEGLP